MKNQDLGTKKQKGKKKISFDNIISRYIEKGDWDYWMKEKEYA